MPGRGGGMGVWEAVAVCVGATCVCAGDVHLTPGPKGRGHCHLGVI